MQPELRDQCQHRWDSILQSCGVDSKIIQKKHQPCPMCGGKDRFRYTDYQGMGYVICNSCCPDGMDGIEFLQQYLSQDFTNVAKTIRSVLGETEAKPHKDVDTAKLKAKLKKTWEAGQALSRGDPVHRYLIGRGLSGISFSEITNIKYHPSLPYWEASGDRPKLVGNFPAMIGLVTDAHGKPASIHCTYLTPDGAKADLTPARKMMTPCRSFQGGAIRLGRPETDQVLCIAEGIETALSMKKMNPEFCVWACIDAGNMSKFEPPEGNVTIEIAADNDESYTGQAAAFALAQRLARKKSVTVSMPHEAGTDWNDVLMQRHTEKR